MVEHNSEFELTKPHISPSHASFGCLISFGESDMRNCDQSGRVIRVMNSHDIDWTNSSMWKHSNLLNHVRVGNANSRNDLETWRMRILISIWQCDRVVLSNQICMWQTTFTFSACASCIVVILSMGSWTELPRKSHIDLVKHTSWQSIKGAVFEMPSVPSRWNPALACVPTMVLTIR